MGSGLLPVLAEVSFLVGDWQGEGVAEYPTMDGPVRFAQRLQITAVPDLGVLSHVASSWDAATGEVFAEESGWWRPGRDGEVELLLAHSLGVMEVYLGRPEAGRVELGTDLVFHTSTGEDVSAGRRLYGRVGEDLGVVVEMAAGGHPMRPHLSAQLVRYDLNAPPSAQPAS
jgi:hypothetical protein